MTTRREINESNRNYHLPVAAGEETPGGTAAVVEDAVYSTIFLATLGKYCPTKPSLITSYELAKETYTFLSHNSKAELNSQLVSGREEINRMNLRIKTMI